MQCRRCRHENETGARFCGGCSGTPRPDVHEVRPSTFPSPRSSSPGCAHPAGAPSAEPSFATPEAYTPRHLAERILSLKIALEGERKQVTVLFADLVGAPWSSWRTGIPRKREGFSTPSSALMMDAVHRYEGTVNQVMGDGLVWPCSAPPLPMKTTPCAPATRRFACRSQVSGYGDELQRTSGVPIQIRVGLNSGEVVVPSHRQRPPHGLHRRRPDHAPSPRGWNRSPGPARRSSPPRRSGWRRAGCACARSDPSRSRAWRSRSKSTSWRGQPPRARASRPRQPGASAASSGARTRWNSCSGSSSRPGRAEGRSSPSWATQGWASHACSTSSPARTTPAMLSSSRAPRFRMARPLHTCRSWNCSRATSGSRIGMTRAPCARRSPGDCSRSTGHSRVRCRPCWRCSTRSPRPIRSTGLDPPRRRQEILGALKRLVPARGPGSAARGHLS